MKKIFNRNWLAILSIFLLPLLLLTACNEVNYFNVEVYSSAGHSIVVGPNKTSSLAEGSEVEISANAGKNNEFICWLKANQVVSIEETYKFKVNAETAGSYIGLFSESQPQFMQYVALTDVSVKLGISQLNIKVKMKLNQEEDQVLYQGEASNQSVSVYNGKVFSILNEDLIVFSADIEYYNDEVLQIEQVNELQLLKSKFDGDKIEVTDKNNILTLTFTKMNKELAQSNFNK